MNKPLIIILLLATLGIWACDTPGNVPPVSENFFIKWYAGANLGNQFGNDIIATSDGGFLIAGTSVGADISEILLIKIDAKGNEEWTYGAAGDLGAASVSEGKSVIELDDSYLVGGSVGEGSAKKSILIKVDFNGIFADSALISTDEPGTLYYNQLSKITAGETGILVSGETMHVSGGVGGGGGLNGYVRLYNKSTLQPDTIGGEHIWYFGLEGNDYVAGAYEVADLSNIGGDNTRYLIFGSSDYGDIANKNKRKFYYVGYDESFTTPNPNIKSSALDTLSRGDQTAAYVTQFNDTYWVIGDTDNNEMFLIGWQFLRDGTKGIDWSPVPGSDRIPTVSTGNESISGVIGKGVAVQSDKKYVIVGDAAFTTNDHEEIYLASVGGNLRIESPWPKTFGTPSSAYAASAVKILPDGSIIIVGTADLEPIKKIIVIKTGPNGEMSF